MDKSLTRRSFLRVLGSTTALAFLPSNNCTQSKLHKPNIIMILADDLSWADVGCYGQQKIKTPNIDKLAAEGMKFTQCYSGSTVCAPSRSCLMQGLHQGHATVRANYANGYRHALQTDDLTIAELLKKVGYKTGIFGKWGLGQPGSVGIPTQKGFDEFFGYLNQGRAHSCYPHHLWKNDQKIFFLQHEGHNCHIPSKYDNDGNVIPNGIKEPEKAQYSFDLIADASLEFIRKNKDEPFFLYLPFTLPHGPLIVPSLAPYTDKNWPSIRLKEWAAMITRLDSQIGKLLQLIKELGIDERTIIFFSSDNGYSAPGYFKDLKNIDPNDFFNHKGPFKGQKGNLYEGGIRVPTIARWTGHIKPRSTSDHVWAFWDILPTAAELAGIDPPSDIDGISILPALLGHYDKQKKHDYLYWEYCGDFLSEQAVRIGDWKGYRNHPNEPTQLYNIREDVEEKNDLAKEYPKIVKEVENIFADARVENPVFPNPGETEEMWNERLRNQGIKLPTNINE